MNKIMFLMAVYWYIFVAIAGVAVALRLILGLAGE